MENGPLTGITQIPNNTFPSLLQGESRVGPPSYPYIYHSCPPGAPGSLALLLSKVIQLWHWPDQKFISNSSIHIPLISIDFFITQSMHYGEAAMHCNGKLDIEIVHFWQKTVIECCLNFLDGKKLGIFFFFFNHVFLIFSLHKNFISDEVIGTGLNQIGYLTLLREAILQKIPEFYEIISQTGRGGQSDFISLIQK